MLVLLHVYFLSVRCYLMLKLVYLFPAVSSHNNLCHSIGHILNICFLRQLLLKLLHPYSRLQPLGTLIDLSLLV